MADIRKAYDVPAKRGMRVRYSPPGKAPRLGTIVGSRDQYLRIRLDPAPGMISTPWNHHPTWCLEYLDGVKI
jgi:hypothetical protein